MEQCSILVVDDDPDILITTELFLSEHFSHVGTISDPWKIIPTLKQDSYDIVLLDMNFQKGIIDGQEGLTWLEKIKNHDPNIVVVLMTAYGDVNLAVQGLKMGALDFILKPWKNEKLLGSVLSGLQIRRSRLEVERLKLTRQTIQQDVKLETDQIISHSPGMNSVVEAAGKVATTDANVLLLGENGVGKDLVAQYIHTLSQRKDQVYVRVDLGAIPESLFESELFGHTKGAFTDAATDKPGRFEIASGGTIFLDEIGNLSFHIQAKLLDVLQNKTVTRLGSNVTNQLDIRLISATNRSLRNHVEKGHFRQDLYYRINTIEITIPPLRERKEDIIPLFNHFLNQFSKKYDKPNLKVNNRNLKQIRNYYWPGNIRELKNAVERAVILSSGHTITLESLLNPLGNTLPDKESMTLAEMEKQFIQKALIRNKGNITKTAIELGIDRNALYRRISKFGL